MNALPAEPAPGSRQYFVLLYAPRLHRQTLATLLAIAEELRAANARLLDHAVAHARLAWWHEEATRFARGTAAHPWLRALAAAHAEPRPDLQPLVAAAAQDLAQRTLAGRGGTTLTGALFVAIAQRLVEPLPHAAAQTLQALGESVAACEQPDAAAPAEPPADIAAHVAALDPALQPALAPLLIWTALALRSAHRRQRQRAAGRFDGLADNLLAWRSARRAARGRFHVE